MNDFMRAFPLEDISIQRTGDGRTVEAYAAVFNTPSEITDQDGHYREQISATAFNKTIADNGTRFGVFYNHGTTIHGTPSDLFSVPIGTPVEVRVESRGLLTVTRYNGTPLADQILEAIKTGSITAQSFSGRFVRSDPAMRPRYGFKPATGGDLPLVTRHEVALREYGPTPFPAYPEAALLGVRAVAALLAAPAAERAEVLKRFEITPDGEPTEPADTPTGAVESPEREPREHSRQQSLAARIRAARIVRGME